MASESAPASPCFPVSSLDQGVAAADEEETSSPLRCCLVKQIHLGLHVRDALC